MSNMSAQTAFKRDQVQKNNNKAQRLWNPNDNPSSLAAVDEYHGRILHASQMGSISY